MTTKDTEAHDATSATGAVGSLVERGVRPAAWIDSSGHPHHLSYVQGVREQQLRGPLRPLYDEQTLWNACARAGDVEREKIKAALLALHEAHKHQHNYYLYAVQDLFVARRSGGLRA